ncbi:DUF3833 family protein [Nocardioides marmoriginsengisoli]|uniref:DUF3833 family protein n=1 Tax=Nocardioides marmoriginsengisoli TaxID=661483 RepID=A0A3N0CDE3_9ACTN|nr:DUF3833 family protein [Nocardioides marmoriginsengisoli]RNL61076.1 DUF3833 family protein [Nocardioides marmoriginsengisoli]
MTSAETDGAPLDLREVFARPWSGRATIRRPWWLRWFPVASDLHFRTRISDAHLAETTGLTVHDTTTFPNGRVWERTMTARLVAPGRWQITADDMPGGAEQTVDAHGFAFTPYTILAPVLGPLRLPLRCTDEIELLDERTMLDTLEMRFLGVRVGTMTMRLERE